MTTTVNDNNRHYKSIGTVTAFELNANDIQVQRLGVCVAKQN